MRRGDMPRLDLRAFSWIPAVAGMTVEVYGNDDKDMKISPLGKSGSFRVFFYLSNKTTTSKRRFGVTWGWKQR
jgi:hypothetical protein